MLSLPSQMPAKLASVAKRPPDEPSNCWTGSIGPKGSSSEAVSTQAPPKMTAKVKANQQKATITDPAIKRGSVVFSFGERL